MKTPIKIIMIACTILAISFAGCRKAKNAEHLPVISDNEPANHLNPYDSFGYWHNAVLDYIDESNIAGKSVLFDRSCGLIRSFYQEKNWPELPDKLFENVPQVVDVAASNIYDLIENSHWSDSVKERLVQLFEQMGSLSLDSCTYPRLKKSIRHFENDVLQSDLSDTDKEAILKIASISRFSSYRWMQEPDAWQPYDQSSLLNVHKMRLGNKVPIATSNTVVAKARFFERIGKWLVVTLCDAGGAIADMSIASGAAASEYMSALFRLH